MPNWTTNYVTLRHFSTKKIKALKEELKKEYPEILNHLRPQPDNIFTGNLGDKEREECIKKGIPNWYDWNCENWGTKWDARRVDLINETANTVDIQFDTAWSPPLEWFDYICSEGWRVHARYKDEGFMFVGVHKHGENLIIDDPLELYIDRQAPQWLIDEWEYEFIGDLWECERINNKGDLLNWEGKIIQKFGTWGDDDVITEYVGERLASEGIL